MKLNHLLVALWLSFLQLGCTSSAIDVAPLKKYQTLRPGTPVVVVSYLGEERIEDRGTLTEMQSDHLLVWSETTSGWMTLLFPGRLVHEIRVLPEEPSPMPPRDSDANSKNEK